MHCSLESCRLSRRWPSFRPDQSLSCHLSNGWQRCLVLIGIVGEKWPIAATSPATESTTRAQSTTIRTASPSQRRGHPVSIVGPRPAWPRRRNQDATAPVEAAMTDSQYPAGLNKKHTKCRPQNSLGTLSNVGATNFWPNLMQQRLQC